MADSAAPLPPNFSPIPTLYAFDPRSTVSQSYRDRDRVNFNFLANRIEEDDDKKIFFLGSIGNVTYNRLESLLKPKSLYDDGIDLVDFSERVQYLSIPYVNTP